MTEKQVKLLLAVATLVSFILRRTMTYDESAKGLDKLADEVQKEYEHMFGVKL